MLRIGLTGGIACGKSRALARLAGHGVATLDLDAVAHRVVAPGGSAHAEVLQAFGPRVAASDGSIDRRALSTVVFADAEARSRLNAIVHPRIRQEEDRRAAEEERRGSAVMVTDAALLIESGLHLRFDRIVVVHCRPEQQLQRLMERDGLDPGSAEARIRAQMPVQEKRLYAHMEVDTSGGLAETDAAADSVARRLMGLAARPGERHGVLRPRALAAFLDGPRRGPRGLTPVGVAEAILESGGLDLAAVARHLAPPAVGPWYHAAEKDAGIAPWTLAAPLVLWASGRSRCDEDYLAGASSSLASLTHERGPAISDAVLVAIAVWKSMIGSDGASEEDRRMAATWGRAPISPGVRIAVESMGVGGAAGEDRDLAALLGAVGRGAQGDAVPGPILRAVDRLLT